MDVFEAIPLPMVIKDEPVDIIDLDDEKTPEEIVNEWHEKIRKKLNQHITPKDEKEFIQTLEWYLNELKVATKDIEDLTNLERFLLHHIKIIEMSYKRLKTFFKTNDSTYLQIMEEVLTYYFDTVLKNIIKKKKEISKTLYRKIKSQICRRFKCLLMSSLLENHQSILHVLINSRLEPGEATYKEIVNHCYSYFLTRVKQEKSEGNYCRCYIMIERWKTVRKPQEHEMLDKSLYAMFELESEEDKRLFKESIERILRPSENNTRAMIRNYFDYIRTCTLNSDMDDLVLDSSSDLMTDSDYDWLDDLSDSPIMESWRIELEKAGEASDDEISPVKMETEIEDDDCMFVSSSLGKANVGKSVLVRELCEDDDIAEIWYHVRDTGQPSQSTSNSRPPRSKTSNTEKLINFNSKIDSSLPKDSQKTTDSLPIQNKTSQTLRIERALSPIDVDNLISHNESINTDINRLITSSDSPKPIDNVPSSENISSEKPLQVERALSPIVIDNLTSHNKSINTDKNRVITSSGTPKSTNSVPSPEISVPSPEISSSKKPLQVERAVSPINIDTSQVDTNQKAPVVKDSSQDISEKLLNSGENLEIVESTLQNNITNEDKLINRVTESNGVILEKDKNSQISQVPESNSPHTKSVTENVPLKDVALSNNNNTIAQDSKIVEENENRSDQPRSLENNSVDPVRARKQRVISEVEKMTNLPEDPLVLVIDKKQGPELVKFLKRGLKKDREVKIRGDVEKEKLENGRNGDNIEVPQTPFASIPTPPSDPNDDQGRDVRMSDQDGGNKAITASHYFSSFALSQEDMELDNSNQPTYQYATITEEPNVTFEPVVVSEVSNCKVIFSEANYIDNTSNGYSVSDISTYDIVMQDSPDDTLQISEKEKVTDNSDKFTLQEEHPVLEGKSKITESTEAQDFSENHNNKPSVAAADELSNDVPHSETDPISKSPLILSEMTSSIEATTLNINENMSEAKKNSINNSTTVSNITTTNNFEHGNGNSRNEEVVEKEPAKITFTATEKVAGRDNASKWDDVTDTQELENILSGPVDTQLKQSTIENPDENFDLFESSENDEMTSLKPKEKVQISANNNLNKLSNNNLGSEKSCESTYSNINNDTVEKVELLTIQNEVSTSPSEDTLVTKRIEDPHVLSSEQINNNDKQQLVEVPKGTEPSELSKELVSVKDLSQLSKEVASPKEPLEKTRHKEKVNGGDSQDNRPSSPEIDSPPFEPWLKGQILDSATAPRSIYRAEQVSGTAGLQTKIRKVWINEEKNEEFIIPSIKKKKKRSSVVKVVIDGEEIKINARSLYIHNISPNDTKLLSGVDGWEYDKEKKLKLTQKEINRWLNLTKLVQRKKAETLWHQQQNCLLKNDQEIVDKALPNLRKEAKPQFTYDTPQHSPVHTNGYHTALSSEPLNKVKKDPLLLFDEPGSKYLRVNKHHLAQADHSEKMHNHKKPFSMDLQPNGMLRTATYKPPENLKTYHRKGVSKKATPQDKKVPLEIDSYIAVSDFPAVKNGILKDKKPEPKDKTKVTKKDSEEEVDSLKNNNVGLRSRTLRNRKRPHLDYEEVTKCFYAKKIAKTKL